VAQLSWFAVDDFWRLELFIKDCDKYHGDLISQILVLMSYCGLYVYVFLCVVAIYDRSLFHVIAWSGILLTEMLMSVITPASGGSQDLYSVCNPHTEGTPCRSTGLVAFVCAFYMLFEVWLGDRQLTAFIIQIIWYFFFLILASVAQLRLFIFNIYEVLLGVVIGGLCGILLWLLTILLVLPYYQSKPVTCFKRWLFVHEKRFM
jgi:hypothetical protein